MQVTASARPGGHAHHAVYILLLWLMSTSAGSAIATIEAEDIQDNTVAEDFPDNSSGACDSIFAGNTDNGFARRALLRFDVGEQIPPGSVINSVTLTLSITRGGNNADSTMTLHPINAAWVEGTEGCGTRGGGQLEVPRQEVGVEVGFKDVLDLCIILTGALDVRPNFPQGVDDGRFPLAFDIIGPLCQAARVDVFYFHNRSDIVLLKNSTLK